MPQSPAGLRVLVVDDLEAMRALIHRALSARGYNVDVASTLAQARELNPAGYDAVLVDAHLGPDEGIDLITELAAKDPAAASRCLLMTGGSTGAAPSGVPYLAKPFKLAELVRAVETLHGTAPHEAEAGQHTSSSAESGAQPPAPAPPGPARAEPAGWRLLELIRLLRQRERADLADFLHDGPIQELTSVSLELQLMSRTATGDEKARCHSLLQRLDAASRSLRWLVDAPWRFQEAETSLPAAMKQRTAWLLSRPLTLASSDQSDTLDAADILAVADVVELMLLGMVPARLPVRTAVAVLAREGMIEVDLTLTPEAANDQSLGEAATVQARAAGAALDNLASILGARAKATLSGQRWDARILLPRISRSG